MAFKYEPKEINFKQAEKYLAEFNENIDTHVSEIKNPESGDVYFVYNFDEEKKGIKLLTFFIIFLLSSNLNL